MVQWDYKFSVFMMWNDVSRGNQKWILVGFFATPWLFFTQQQFTSEQHPDETDVITNHHDRPVNNGSVTAAVVNKKEENGGQLQQRGSIRLHFCLLHISASEMRNVVIVWAFLWNRSSWFPRLHLQQAISNHSKNMSRGDGEGKWKQQVQAMTFADS